MPETAMFDSDSDFTISRRTMLQGLTAGAATAATGGAGLLALSGGGAAAHVDFVANEVTISTDTGDVDDVFVDPVSRVEGANFDVPITKVRQLLLARIRGTEGAILTDTPDPNPTPGEDGYWPVYRTTPWNFESAEPANADFEYNGDPVTFAQADYMTDAQFEGFPGQKEPGTSFYIEYPLLAADRPIWLAKEDTDLPDYEDSDLTGVSVGNTPDHINGSYGTLGNADRFDNETDDSVKTLTVDLILMTTLHTDYDFAENVPTPDTANPDSLSPLAMGNSPDVGHQFGEDTHAIPYADLYEHCNDHPAIDVTETSFDVHAVNEVSKQEIKDGDGGEQSLTTANTGGS